MTGELGQHAVARPRRHRLRLALEILGIATLAGLCVLAVDFAWFLVRIAVDKPGSSIAADAIVVPTGGASRIEDGLDLLARKRGRRLLITGVYRATRAEELARLSPQKAELFACCVDIDRRALNTTGNAIETSLWARRHGFRSLIVVTSTYHMPRTLVELGSAMPGVTLIPQPVVSGLLRAEPWWASLRTARVVVIEYLKYVVARLRLRLEPTASPAATTD